MVGYAVFGSPTHERAQTFLSLASYKKEVAFKINLCYNTLRKKSQSMRA